MAINVGGWSLLFELNMDYRFKSFLTDEVSAQVGSFIAASNHLKFWRSSRFARQAFQGYELMEKMSLSHFRDRHLITESVEKVLLRNQA